MWVKQFAVYTHDGATSDRGRTLREKDILSWKDYFLVHRPCPLLRNSTINGRSQLDLFQQTYPYNSYYSSLVCSWWYCICNSNSRLALGHTYPLKLDTNLSCGILATAAKEDMLPSCGVKLLAETAAVLWDKVEWLTSLWL